MVRKPVRQRSYKNPRPKFHSTQKPFSSYFFFSERVVSMCTKDENEGCGLKARNLLDTGIKFS